MNTGVVYQRHKSKAFTWSGNSGLEVTAADIRYIFGKNQCSWVTFSMIHAKESSIVYLYKLIERMAYITIGGIPYTSEFVNNIHA